MVSELCSLHSRVIFLCVPYFLLGLLYNVKPLNVLGTFFSLLHFSIVCLVGSISSRCGRCGARNAGSQNGWKSGLSALVPLTKMSHASLLFFRQYARSVSRYVQKCRQWRKWRFWRNFAKAVDEMIRANKLTQLEGPRNVGEFGEISPRLMKKW